MNIKLALIWVLSLTTCFTFLQAADNTAVSTKKAEQTLRDPDTDFDDCDDCETRLRISNLCARRIKAIRARFKELCAEHIKTDFVCTDSLTVNYSLNLAANDLCAQALSTSDLCVSGTARINEVCGNFRAFAEYSTTSTLYTLGDLLNFDNITDNPNGNLTTGPTQYTVPVNGYYIISLAIHQLDIFPTGAVLGTPTSVLTVYVNGVSQRSSYFPYLTFNSEQDSSLSALIRLKAGDLVTAAYTNLVVNQAVGTINIAGTAEIQGGDGSSFFAIHYLSSDCATSSCTPCTPNMGTGSTCDNQCGQPCNR
jgi:hypothetical protein